MTIKSYNESTSSYTTELAEHFGTDANGYSSDTLAYDNNGNLTYDGTQAYTYDAWNRLASVAHAYTVAGDVPPAPHVGQAFERMRYDAAGRRIIKEIGNTGDTGYHLRATGAMDATYHDYYNGQSNIEERVGSASGSGYGPGLVIKQRVWGLGYVDELIQTAINSDPTNTSHQTGTQNACDRLYWLYQDANYNVVAVFNASHNYVERYEYSAYGQREVFTSSGYQDGWCYLPTSMSGRVVAVGGVVEPWGINDVGHQGLVHDEESGLVYNRARMLQPTLGRFTQEDPIFMPNNKSIEDFTSNFSGESTSTSRMWNDGISAFQYCRDNPTNRTDTKGTLSHAVVECDALLSIAGANVKHCRLIAWCDSRPGFDVYESSGPAPGTYFGAPTYSKTHVSGTFKPIVAPGESHYDVEAPTGDVLYGDKEGTGRCSTCNMRDCLVDAYNSLKGSARPYGYVVSNSNSFIKSMLDHCDLQIKQTWATWAAGGGPPGAVGWNQ